MLIVFVWNAFYFGNTLMFGAKLYNIGNLIGYNEKTDFEFKEVSGKHLNWCRIWLFLIFSMFYRFSVPLCVWYQHAPSGSQWRLLRPHRGPLCHHNNGKTCFTILILLILTEIWVTIYCHIARWPMNPMGVSYLV